MTEGTSGYQVDYFVPLAREVLGKRLAEQGFKYVGDDRGVTAHWAAGPVFVRVGYLPETMPNYELLLGVGRSDASPVGPKSSENSIGVWRLLPDDEAPQIANWRFDSPERLREELDRAWTEAFLPHVLPVLEDEDELIRAIAEHDDELTSADAHVMNDRLLRFAREKFQEGLFAEASAAYDELPSHRLSRADAKRADFARRRMRS